MLACYFLYGSWWSLYLLELGATAEIVGLWFTITNILGLAFQLPGGILADRFGRKKVYVASTIFRAISMILWLPARTWLELTPGLIVHSLADIYVPALQAILAESLSYEKRGSAFAAYRTVTMIPQILMPFVSGIIIDRLGVSSGIRTALIIMLIVSSIFVFIRAKFLEETLQISKIGKKRKVLESFSYLFKAKRSLIFMLIVASLISFSIGIIRPFTVIYAIQTANFSMTQWGALQTIIVLVGTIFQLPGGVISDRFGRKKCIFLSSLIFPLEMLGLFFIRDFNLLLALYVLLGVGRGLGGGIRGTVGGPAWQALLADLVESSERGKIIGLIALVSGLFSMPSSIIGGYLYAFNVETLFWFSILLGLIAVSLFYIFVREPKIREE
jgi:MFS family permease